MDARLDRRSQQASASPGRAPQALPSRRARRLTDSYQASAPWLLPVLAGRPVSPWLGVNPGGLFDPLIAPYSARANALSTVSTPLHWREVTGALDPSFFTIHTVPRRLSTGQDPFGRVLPAPPRLEQLAV